jgi:dTMP kinase
MARGLFITLEGGEGAGKSTQAARLATHLRAAGRSAVTTREPGGSPGAEAIRALLVTGEVERWSATTETLLMYAARFDHVERVIVPALARGEIVICDRFADSTRAYQGAGGGANLALIDALEAETRVLCWPDLTLIFDLAPDRGLERASSRPGDETRFEAKGLAFHRRLRDAFLSIAKAEPERCRIIDAAADEVDVEVTVWAAVSRCLGQ